MRSRSISFAASWYFLPWLAMCAVLLSAGPCPASPISRGRRPARAGMDGWRSLADDLDAHRARSALDLLHRGVHVVGVEVGHLDARDLADLVARHPSDGLAPGRHRTLLDTGRLAEQVRGRRGLEDERERAVLEDRDL